ncbi:MAG: peptidylprolyl isomerase [Euryarchaeota archaeon]|nr:peptidylprolyl isomerase [Euryarchaeota archaeon]
MGNPKVKFETTMGTFVAEIYQDKVPTTAKNFLQYVQEKHFDGTIFHRVIKGFVIQGGGFTPGMKEKATRAPIPLETKLMLKHEDGSLSMARTSNPDSGTSQFFVCLGAQRALDPKGPRDGYAVFGKVVSGLDVVKKIGESKTTSKGGHDDVPAQDVVVTKATLGA